MKLRTFRNFFALSLGVASLVAISSDALAAPKDKEAIKLHDQAMDEDYLSVEFDKAEEKLTKAIDLCGEKDCSKEVLGKLFIARATVLGVGKQNIDGAKEDLVKALAANPNAKLLEGLTTPELEAAYAEAKGSAGTGGDEVEPDEPTPAAAGDFSHTPPEEQEIHHPVPVFAEVPEEFGAEKVILRYKPFGGVKWVTLELKKIDGGFGGEIPCRDVTTTGELRYYLIAADAEDTPMAVAGSAKSPFKVQIVNQLSGDPPSLPGKSPPQRCAAKEDCPPGLPGCPDASGRGDKGWGASCEETQECESGLICLNGACEEGEEDGGDGKKSDKIGLLVNLTGALDIALVGGQENVCSPESNDAYACFVTSTGEQFYGNPADVAGSNGISGGLGIGGARVMLGADYMLLRDVGLGLGARVGFAFGGSPSSDTTPPEGSGHSQAKSFLPLHAEGRASFFFPGGGHFETGGIKGHGFLGGGVAQVNASVPVKVCDQAKTEGDTGGCSEGRLENVDAYQITGLNFIGFGGGASYMITDLVGVTGEVKFMVMLPTTGFVISPTIGPFLAF